MTTRFQDGQQGSAGQVKQAFSELSAQGQTSINTLVVTREDTLILFNNALMALNGKRVRAARLAQIGVTAKFLTSDLVDINQPITTATVRCDSNSVSLRERAAPGEAIVNQVRFSASEGTIQALNVPQVGSSGNLGALYRVATPDGSIPVGTFDIQLIAPVSLSLCIFDMMDMPSSATVAPQISQNGINFTDAVSVTRNGYRLSAYFTPQEIKYIRLVVTPALPDTLGGTVYTFGLTDFHAFSVQYHLRSDVYTNQIEIAPQSLNLQFVTETEPGLSFFLGLGINPPIQVFPGQVIAVPGAAAVTRTNQGLTVPTGSAWTNTTNYVVGNTILDTNGNLQKVVGISGTGTSGGVHPVWGINGATTIDNPGANQVVWQHQNFTALVTAALPSDIYINTLSIQDHATHVDVRIAPGLPVETVGLTNQYITVVANVLSITPFNQATDGGRTFDISYVHGPASTTVTLQVELTTGDLNDTPIYDGAQLNEI